MSVLIEEITNTEGRIECMNTSLGAMCISEEEVPRTPKPVFQEEGTIPQSTNAFSVGNE